MQVYGEAIDHERQNVGAERVADENDLLLLPSFKIVAQNPPEVPRSLLRGLGVPEILQRVQSDRWNAAGCEALPYAPVRDPPAAVARNHDCQGA